MSHRLAGLFQSIAHKNQSHVKSIILELAAEVFHVPNCLVEGILESHERICCASKRCHELQRSTNVLVIEDLVVDAHQRVHLQPSFL